MLYKYFFSKLFTFRCCILRLLPTSTIVRLFSLNNSLAVLCKALQSCISSTFESNAYPVCTASYKKTILKNQLALFLLLNCILIIHFFIIHFNSHFAWNFQTYLYIVNNHFFIQKNSEGEIPTLFCSVWFALLCNCGSEGLIGTGEHETRIKCIIIHGLLRIAHHEP